jgi:hypothetical protein
MKVMVRRMKVLPCHVRVHVASSSCRLAWYLRRRRRNACNSPGTDGAGLRRHRAISTETDQHKAEAILVLHAMNGACATSSGAGAVISVC